MSNCVGQHRDEKDRHAARGHLCSGCYARLERDIAEMPALAQWLHQALASGGGGGEKVRGTRENASPIRVDVFDEITDIGGKLAEWARLVSEERTLRGPRDSQPETTAPFLLAHLDWVSEQPWVDEMAAEMAELRREAHKVAPWRPRKNYLPAPCPVIECDLLALVRWDGSDHVECEACGRVWSEDDYQRLVVVAATGQPVPKHEREAPPSRDEYSREYGTAERGRVAS